MAQTYREVVDELGEAWYQYDDRASAQDYRVQAMNWENKEDYERAKINALLSISKALEAQSS